MQILETFEGNSYVNGKVCPIAREKKLESVDYWMDENIENQISIWSQQ